MNHSGYRVILRTVFYVGANTFSRMASLILLPLLVATLSAEDFSRYGLFLSVITISLPLLTLNIYLAPGRLFFDYDEALPQQNLLFSALVSALALLIASVFIVMVMLSIFNVYDPISERLLSRKILIICVLVLELMNLFGRMLLRIKGEGFLYLISALAQSLGLVGGYFVLSTLKIIPMFETLLLAYIISRGSAILITFSFYLRQFGVASIVPAMIWECARFSAPTSVHQIALWAVNQSGRWIGLLYLSLGEMTPYNLVIQMYAAVAMLSRAIFEALLPDYNAAFGSNDYQRGLRMLRWASIVSVLLVVLIYISIILVLFVFGIQLPSDYAPSLTMIVIAAIVSALDAIYLHGIQLLQAVKATHIQASVTVASGLFTVLTSFLLVQSFNETGLLLATALGWGFQSVLSNVMAFRSLARVQKAIVTA